MEWLNYHHLLYFWTVVRDGSVVRASDRLHLSPSTLSGQIRKLEESLGEKLFARVGRRLEPTEMGRLVYRYADEIFDLGRELLDTVKGRPTGQPVRLVVGIAESIPKLVTRRLLLPVLSAPEPVRLTCVEDHTERLLARLALHEADLILSDAPVPAGLGERAFSHLLGESGVGLFAEPRLHARLKRGFPSSLDEAPILLPTIDSALRRSLDGWIERLGVHPRLVGEFNDSALLNVFGQQGLGAFAAPLAVRGDVEQRYGVRLLGAAEGVTERFYALSVERRLRHPAVVTICEAARTQLFTA
jgi:LysR family transcriptional activator of nhaA